jgi:pimeloyl-ACP methyl ester carboxylesterase
MMPSAPANGITIEYETIGNPESPPVLLITGFNCQLTEWDPLFLQALAESGFYVIFFDNRDVGLSTWFDDGQGDGAGAVGEQSAPSSYSMSDMAADTVGLLDFLGVESAHVVGYSMGGMIAQTLAIEHPERVRTLTSISSSTGNPAVGQPQPEALAVLLAPPARSRAEAVEVSLAAWRVIGSPGFPLDEEALSAHAAADYDRAFHPSGSQRQLNAIVSQPDRTDALAGVKVPTLVIHGESDVLVDPSGGIATALAIPGARLKLVPGLGHDIHPDLFSELVSELSGNFLLG